MTEQRILDWCSKIIIASAVLMFGIPVLILMVYDLFQGRFEIFGEPIFFFGIVFVAVYLASVYFLFSLEGKAINRRLYSWFQSFIFHYCLFLFAAIYLHYSNGNIEVLVLLSPEVLVGTLSFVGYFMARKGRGLSPA